jgi:hypothetical protein
MRFKRRMARITRRPKDFPIVFIEFNGAQSGA